MASILTIRPPEALKNDLKNKANEIGISVNALIITILNDYIKSAQQGKE